VYQPETAAAPRELGNTTREAEPVPSGIIEKSVDTLAAAEVAEVVEVAEPQALSARAASHGAEEWVSFHLHRDALERFVPGGARVLETTPGGGRYTEVLHRLGCKLSVLSASAGEREALQARAGDRGYANSVEHWLEGDITHLAAIPDGAFDAVVAFEGALSYALERRDRALRELVRVLQPRGVLILSAFSLWGTLHRHLPHVLARDLVDNRAVVRSGNAPAAVFGHGRQCHLFRGAEFEAFLRRGGLEILSLSASSALSTGVPLAEGADPSAWSALLEYERAACSERGYLDSGSEIIAVARR
jgi:SAM-dependent methyltransferase